MFPCPVALKPLPSGRVYSGPMLALATPDVLVLGVGGVLGEAWMSGFLAGAAARTGIEFRDARCFVGTSAGAIVAARLAAGVPPDRSGGPAGAASKLAAAGPREVPPARRGRIERSTIAPVTAAVLRGAAPAGALARSALLAGVPDGRMSLDPVRARIARLGAAFDGRLRVAAVDRRNGRRVVFGSPGGPTASVADAVAASCAVPGVFAPVRIGTREYVDGGVWSPTNLDVAPVGRGARVLCLVPTAVLEGAPTGLFRALARAWSLATAFEAVAARGAGVEVTIIEPDSHAAAAMGRDLMDPRPREQVRAAGFAHGLAAAGEPARSHAAARS